MKTVGSQQLLGWLKSIWMTKSFLLSPWVNEPTAEAEWPTNGSQSSMICMIMKRTQTLLGK